MSVTEGAESVCRPLAEDDSDQHEAGEDEPEAE